MFNPGKLAASFLTAATAFGISLNAQATIVEFHTSHGNFQINLHDEATPETVENFLNYVNDGRYVNTIVHRLVPKFVMQSGGYIYEGKTPLDLVETDDPVVNEPVYSNVRGTVAMAKLGGKPDSATSQWFVNLKDNSGGSASLDTQNGGFTVFGEIIADGMDVIDEIAKVNLCGDIPMPDVSKEDCADKEYQPGYENFVIVENVTIVDSSPNTADDLDPVPNTAIGEEPTNPSNPTQPGGGGSSGGSLGWAALLALAVSGLRRKI